MFVISLGSSPVSWPVSGTRCEVKMAAVEVAVNTDTAGSEAQHAEEPLQCLIVLSEKNVLEVMPPHRIVLVIKHDILYRTIRPVALLLRRHSYCGALPNCTGINPFACER